MHFEAIKNEMQNFISHRRLLRLHFRTSESFLQLPAGLARKVASTAKKVARLATFRRKPPEKQTSG